MTKSRKDRPELRTQSLEELFEQDIPERQKLLGSWLMQRDLSMVYATAGVGKSMFTLSLGLAVGGGGEYLSWKALKPRRVLVVDGEMDVADLKERAVMLHAAVPGLDAAAAGRNVRFLARQDQEPGAKFPDLALQEGQDVVLRLAKEHKAELVILDNFSTLATVEDENAASSFDPIIDLMQELKQLDCAVMLVHHSRKGGAGQQSYRGSSKMEVVFNSMLELTHPNGVPSLEGTAFDINWAKFRGRRDDTIQPLRVQLEEPEGGSPAWSHDVNEDQRLTDLIRLVQSAKYGTQAELAEKMKISTGLISKLKARAMAQDKITKHDWDRCMEAARGVIEEDEFEELENNDF